MKKSVKRLSFFRVLAVFFIVLNLFSISAAAAQSADSVKEGVISVTFEPSEDTHKTFVITVKGRAAMVQLINPGGSTSTTDRYGADVVSYNASGKEVCSTARTLDYEVWTFCTNMAAQGTLRARAKFASASGCRVYWEREKDSPDVYSFPVDTLGYTNTVYGIRVSDVNAACKTAVITVETDKYCKGIRLAFSDGSTADSTASSCVPQSPDGRLLFCCPAKLIKPGVNVISVSTVNCQGKAVFCRNVTVSVKAPPDGTQEKALEGKKAVFLGDSVFAQAEYKACIDYESTRGYPNYTSIPSLVKAATGADTYNFAICGTTASSRINSWGNLDGEGLVDAMISGDYTGAEASVKTLSERSGVSLSKCLTESGSFFMDGFNFSDVDYFLFNWGTNDWANWKDAEKWCRSITAVVCKLRSAYPEAQLVLCSVTPRFKTEGSKKIEQTDLRNYVSAGEALAEELNIHFINLYDIGINSKNEYGAGESGYLSDGLHPTAKGCRLIADAVSDGLTGIENSLPVSSADKSVVCTGDSGSACTCTAAPAASCGGIRSVNPFKAGFSRETVPLFPKKKAQRIFDFFIPRQQAVLFSPE